MEAIWSSAIENTSAPLCTFDNILSLASESSDSSIIILKSVPLLASLKLSIICVVISTSSFEHQTCIFTSLFFALSEEFSVVPACVLSCDLFDTPHPVSNETPMAATSVVAINLFIHIHPFSLFSIYNLVQFYHTFTKKNRSNLIFLTNLDLFLKICIFKRYLCIFYLIMPESASFTEAIASGIPAGFFPPA